MDPGAPDPDVGIAAVVADAGTGVALWLWHVTRPARAVTGTAVSAMASTVLELAPPGPLTALAERGRAGRAGLEELVRTVLRRVVRHVVPHVVTAVLETTDLTELVRRHVDLDAVAAGLDLDAVAARLDLDAVLARVDLDAVVAKVDLDAAVARVDLDAVVDRIDLEAAAARLDLDAIVRRVDLDDLAARIDVGAVAARVDPDPLVARVDLDAVLARVDVVGIAREVIDAIDLPEIVRHSTGTLTSDTIRTVRREAMEADDVVAGVLARLLRRRAQRAPAPS